jgi:hypothetical protein
LQEAQAFTQPPVAVSEKVQHHEGREEHEEKKAEWS